MKILFAPSESKNTINTNSPISSTDLVFPELFDMRLEVLRRYQTIIDEGDSIKLQKLFGIKNENIFKSNIFTSLTSKAVERYNGVAYEHLAYSSLDENSQKFIDSNVMIFSNLFGPILAADHIPIYKLQQGETLDDFRCELFYREHFSSLIDLWLEDDIVLDLRAGFYEKFYTLKSPYITMKFLKNGKVVSHFAKAYRGEVLRQIAIFKPKNEKEFGNIAFKNLKIREIITKKLKQEYVFEISDV